MQFRQIIICFVPVSVFNSPFKEMFPNIGGNINSEKSRLARKNQATFDQSELVKMAPADWITYRLNRWKFDNGQGVGFSAVAEPYLNFGTAGVVLFFVFLKTAQRGSGLNFSQVACKKGDPPSTGHKFHKSAFSFYRYPNKTLTCFRLRIFTRVCCPM